MRQERMRTASIDDKLQDLIAKSDVITKLLQGQLDSTSQAYASAQAYADELQGARDRVEADLARAKAAQGEAEGELGRSEARVQELTGELEELRAWARDARAADQYNSTEHASLQQTYADLHHEYSALQVRGCPPPVGPPLTLPQSAGPSRSTQGSERLGTDASACSKRLRRPRPSAGQSSPPPASASRRPRPKPGGPSRRSSSWRRSSSPSRPPGSRPGGLPHPPARRPAAMAARSCSR